MTCPFYVAGRHPCALGEPDGRHCGPRQYPVGPCNLDEIGRGEAWRAGLGELMDYVEEVEADYPIYPNRWSASGPRDVARMILRPVGWSP